MNGTAATVSYEVRPYMKADEPEVLSLLDASLGGGPAGKRTAEFFRWKHLENPFGRSFMLVAVLDGRVVGFRAFMRWEFRAHDRTLRAVRAVDTATHPDFQGLGIFSRLTREAIDALRSDVDLVFNTPNKKSGPGYLKMGWHPVGQIRVWIRPARPLRFALLARSIRSPGQPSAPIPIPDAARAEDVLEDGTQIRQLLASGGEANGLLATLQDFPYLKWRYGAAPLLDYRFVSLDDGGLLRGLAFFRVRPRGRLWEATVGDVIASDARDTRRLLTRVSRASGADYVACRFPRPVEFGRIVTRAGYIRVPGGMTFIVNVLGDGLRPDPASMNSWSLSLGDLEVF